MKGQSTEPSTSAFPRSPAPDHVFRHRRRRLLVADELASGALVELLPGWRLPAGPPLYAVYPARQWLALNTATFVAFLQERLFQ